MILRHTSAFVFFCAISLFGTSAIARNHDISTRELYLSCKEAIQNEVLFEQSFCQGYMTGIAGGIYISAMTTISEMTAQEQENFFAKEKSLCRPQGIRIKKEFEFAKKYVDWISNIPDPEKEQDFFNNSAFVSVFSFWKNESSCK